MSSSAFPQAFDLDSQCADGHVALVFTAPDRSAIYFQSASTRWYYVASTFEDYHRLLLMHVGVRGWLYAFTDVGLTAATRQWMSFLAPQRLAIDLAHGRTNRDQWMQRSAAAKMDAAGREGGGGGGANQHHARSSAHAAVGLSLAKIDELAQSVLALQLRSTKSSAHSLATSGTDDEEEE